MTLLEPPPPKYWELAKKGERWAQQNDGRKAPPEFEPANLARQREGTSMPPSAVLDTQILIRGFHTARGATGRLMKAIQEKDFDLITSEPLLEELRRTFSLPAVQRLSTSGPLSPADIDENIAALRALATKVLPGHYEVDLVSTDPKDNPVLACALESAAEFVVSEDRRDLLRLKVIRVSGHQPIQIVSASGFLRILRGLTSPL
jgi:putative PIN family toxin of toxin-antitoxin system